MQTIYDIQDVLAKLPHRYPLLLVDRIVELEKESHVIGLKNVTFNEPQFMGHFPGKPIMPGVLIIEAMAQVSALLALETLGAEAEGKLVYFMTIDGGRFRKPVVPGDSLYIHSAKERSRGAVWKFNCEAKVDGQKVAEAQISAMLAEE